MLNLGSKTSTSSLIFSIPSNFRNHRWGTETLRQEYFFDSISYYYFKHKSMKSLSFEKVSDGQSDLDTTIIRSQKIDVRP